MEEVKFWCSEYQQSIRPVHPGQLSRSPYTFLTLSIFLDSFFLDSFFLETFFLVSFFLDSYFLDHFFLDYFFLDSFFLTLSFFLGFNFFDFLDNWLKPDFDITGQCTKLISSFSDLEAHIKAIALKNEVCPRCLRHMTPGHYCSFKQCTIVGCNQWHHTVLHLLHKFYSVMKLVPTPY